MPRPIQTALVTLVVAATWCHTARAQKEILDNIILLGPAETLNLPNVHRVDERPEEKTPPEPYESTLGDDPFHRPLSTRFEPGQGYMLEEAGRSLKPPRVNASRPGSEALGGPAERGTMELPPLPEPLNRPKESTAARLAAVVARDLIDPGPPGGLTLDQAIGQLIHNNQDLRTKFHEIPQAEADILTAGLRGNPIIFWSAGGTPYGRFSNQPGVRDYPIVITYLLDLTGRRVARVQVAKTSKRVLDARYQDEVRRKIDVLDKTFVDLLEARAGVRAARRAAAQAADDAQARQSLQPPGGRRKAAERALRIMSLRNAEDRLHGARRNLAALLGIPAQDADQIEPYAPLRDSSGAPPIEVLMHIAQSCRADLVAQRLSVDRAVALEKMEYSRRLRDTYILYEPWDYQTGQTNQGERGVNTWAIALFAPLPVFDRNQGNIQRARLEISKMQSAVADVERQVADEVHEAWNDFQTSLADQQEIEAQVLPVVSEALAEAGRAVQAGRLGADGYRGAKSETR